MAKQRRAQREKKGSFSAMAAAKLIILGVVIVCGVAAIIWIRTLGEALGAG